MLHTVVITTLDQHCEARTTRATGQSQVAIPSKILLKNGHQHFWSAISSLTGDHRWLDHCVTYGLVYQGSIRANGDRAFKQAGCGMADDGTWRRLPLAQRLQVRSAESEAPELTLG